MGSAALRLTQAATIVFTGAPCPVQAGARSIAWGQATTLAAGTIVSIGPPSRGLRSYLAVRGGLAVDPILGSASTDTLGGIGPVPLTDGIVLETGRVPGDDVPDVPVVVGAEGSTPRAGTDVVVVVLPGPHSDCINRDSSDALSTTGWVVGADSNRVGVRLGGPALTQSDRGELPSEPTVPGAIQLPPGGEPIVFGPDAPTTGGYPVIGVVRDADLDVFGQLRPGDVVRLRLGIGWWNRP